MNPLTFVYSPRKEALSVGSRASKLALRQVEEVYHALRFHHPDLLFNLRCIRSKGDKDQKTSLKDLGSTDFFTYELDQWLLEGKIRVAIHSAKDLPDPLPKGLKIIALTSCLENKDTLVFRKGFYPSHEESFFKVGASSYRREEAVLKKYPRAELFDLRGTIEGRLNQLGEGKLDALVVAKVALMRLGYTDYEMLDLDAKTSPLQGSLAIVAREEDLEMQELFCCIDSRLKERSLYLGLDPNRFLTRGEVTHYPLIEIHPLKLTQEHLKAFDEKTYLLVTSRSTLKVLFKLFEKDPLRLRRLREKRVIAVGLSTRQFAIDQNLSVDYVAGKECQEGLINLFSQIPPSVRSQIFYPKSTQARPLLLDFLNASKFRGVICDLYETRAIRPPKKPCLKNFSELVFTSASVVNSFFEIYNFIPKGIRTLFKGKPTRDAFQKKILQLSESHRFIESL